MSRTPVTARLPHQLLAAARIDGVVLVHVAVVVELLGEHNRTALLLHRGDGDAFSPATWQVPTGLLLAPRDELTDVIGRVVTHTAGLDLDTVTSYLGHHDQHRPDRILRTFGLTVTVTDPTRMRRNALFGHQWVRLDQTPLPLPAATTAGSRHFLRLAAGHPAPYRVQPPLAAELRARAHGLYTAEARLRAVHQPRHLVAPRRLPGPIHPHWTQHHRQHHADGPRRLGRRGRRARHRPAALLRRGGPRPAPRRPMPRSA